MYVDTTYHLKYYCIRKSSSDVSVWSSMYHVTYSHIAEKAHTQLIAGETHTQLSAIWSNPMHHNTYYKSLHAQKIVIITLIIFKTY